MARRIRYTVPAQRFVESELVYLGARSVAAARRLRTELEAAESRILRFPELGPETPVRSLRRLVFASYVLTYRRIADEIEIVSIRHGRQADPEQPTPTAVPLAEDC